MKRLRVRFYVRTRTKNRFNESPIYSFIKVNDSGKPMTTDKFITLDRWRATNQLTKTKVLKEQTIANYLYNVFKPKITQEFERLVSADVDFNVNDLIEIVSEKKNRFQKKGLSMIAGFDLHYKHFKTMVDTGKKSKATLEKYKRIKGFFIDFLDKNYGVKDIAIKNITKAMINQFAYFLHHEKEYKDVKGLGHNTAVKYMRNFRTVFNHIMDFTDELEINPMRHYKESILPVETTFLTEEELNAIRTKDFDNDRMNNVRDIFVFNCFTGLAPVDLTRVTHEHFDKKNGEVAIKINRQKTKIQSYIPLMKPALDIMSKYKEDPRCVVSGKILPFISDVNMNLYLKELADLCGIKKHLTWYVARHTFATYMLNKGVPIEVVSKMLGHTNTKQTHHYAKLLNKTVDEHMYKLNGIIE